MTVTKVGSSCLKKRFEESYSFGLVLNKFFSIHAYQEKIDTVSFLRTIKRVGWSI